MNNNTNYIHEFGGRLNIDNCSSYCNELKDYKSFVYKLGFISKENFNININLDYIDFGDKDDLVILFNIIENIFNNYYIYIYKEWIFDLNDINTQKNNIKDDNFTLEILINDFQSGKSNEFKSIIYILIEIIKFNKLRLKTSPIILITAFNKEDYHKSSFNNIYEKCLKDNKYIDLHNIIKLNLTPLVLFEEERNNIKFYNNIIKGIKKKRPNDMSLFNIISTLILTKININKNTYNRERLMIKDIIIEYLRKLS